MNGTLSLKFLKSHTKILLRNPKLLFFTTARFSENGSKDPLTSLQCGKILQSLTNTKFLEKGQQLHAYMLTSNTLQNNTYLYTKLSAFYANCGRMAEAEVIFYEIVWKNAFLWNFMIRGYACNGYSLKSLVLYREMWRFGWKGDKYTFPFVLKACGDFLAVDFGRRVHGEVVVCGLESDIYVGNSLLAMYAKFGDTGMARRVFDRMVVRDLTSWNTMISGYAKSGEPKEAFTVFELTGKDGFVADGTTLLALLSACADLVALTLGKAIHGYIVRNMNKLCNDYLTNSLIEMYSNCNAIVDARRLFDGVTWNDIVSWNSMISGYARNENALESLRLFVRMVLEGVEPDQITVVAVLGACYQITALQFGMSVHSYLLKNGFGANTIVGTALIDMYSKCGSLACSRCAFDEMSDKNLVSWSAMISGYGVHGRGRDAISLFDELTSNGILLDGGVLISVLSACSHAGLVDEGKEIFNRMTKEYNVKPAPAHYSCLVDLLSRAGRLYEAYELINNMDVEPTSDIWAALLSACWLHRNVKLAEIAAQKVFYMNPKQVGSYVSLSNIYASEKRWDDVERVRAMVRRKGLKKPPGCSSVELDKMVH